MGQMNGINVCVCVLHNVIKQWNELYRHTKQKTHYICNLYYDWNVCTVAQKDYIVFM